MKLRDYQTEALDKVKAGMRNGHIRQILCAPTGAGKTVIAAAIIEGALEKNSRVAFIADRIALVEQTSMRLHEAGIHHGVLQGSSSYGRNEKVQVCSAQTLEKRGFWPGLDLIIVDEAHTQRKMTIEMLTALDKPAVGLTATPFSKGMGKTYSSIVNARTTNNLIEDGWLVRPRVFCATEIDMTGAAVNNRGEWGDREVESRAIPIVGDIVSEWVTHTQKIFGGPVKTLLFTPTIAYSEELCRQFNAAGYRFEVVSYKGGSRDSRRRGNIDDFRAGRIDGLASCEALAKGFDVPDALCLISARPYRKSLASHIQQLGRIMRSSPGKSFGLVLDHAGNYLRHAAATEDFWANGCDELDDGNHTPASSTAMEVDHSDRKCVGCGFIMPFHIPVCPMCGVERQRKKHGVQVVAGKLSEYKSLSIEVGDLWPHVSRLAVNRHPTDFDRARKFAVAQYKNLTGSWPAFGRTLEPLAECDPRVELAVEDALANWLKSKRRGSYAARAHA